MAMLLTMLVISGGITQQFFAQRLEGRFHTIQLYMSEGGIRKERPGVTIPPPTANDVQGDLLHITVVVDIILVGIAGILGYALSGLTLKPIQEAYNKQKRLLSDVSHELRTPLAILRANTENTLHGASEKHQALLQASIEEIDRMNSLVDDLLFLSKAEQGQDSLSTVNLQEMLRTCKKRLSHIAKEHHVTLALSPLPKDSLFVLAPDADLVLRAVTNVIQNAILYNSHNGTVKVSLTQKGRNAIITVEDTGVGIPEKDLPYIFDRFTRAEKSRSRTTGGSGLGLSIVQEILQSIRGKISIKSTENVGTVVTISLPIHKTS